MGQTDLGSELGVGVPFPVLRTRAFPQSPSCLCRRSFPLASFSVPLAEDCLSGIGSGIGAMILFSPFFPNFPPGWGLYHESDWKDSVSKQKTGAIMSAIMESDYVSEACVFQLSRCGTLPACQLFSVLMAAWGASLLFITFQSRSLRSVFEARTGVLGSHSFPLFWTPSR